MSPILSPARSGSCINTNSIFSQNDAFPLSIVFITHILALSVLSGSFSLSYQFDEPFRREWSLIFVLFARSSRRKILFNRWIPVTVFSTCWSRKESLFHELRFALVSKALRKSFLLFHNNRIVVYSDRNFEYF